MPRLLAGIALLLVWEVVVRLFAPAYVAKPSGVIMVFPKVITDPQFLQAVGATLLAVAEGLAIAMVTGTLIGLAIGRSPGADRALRHYINGFYAIPMIIVLPLFSLWFGYTGATRIATIVFAAMFSIIMNVVRRRPRGAARIHGSGALVRLEPAAHAGRDRAAVLDAIPAWPASGSLRGRALIGAVVAEFFLSIGGVGYFILYNSRSFHHNEAFVGVMLLALFGVGFEALIGWVTRRFCRGTAGRRTRRSSSAHSRASGNPAMQKERLWVPAFAGTSGVEIFCDD